jgi:uncharacterized protein YutE (UPF0331/DUF86 family)
MIEEAIVIRKLTILGDCLTELSRVRESASASALASNAMLRAAVERWLQVSIEACLDIAYHIVSDEGWTPVDTGRAAFAALADHGVIDADLAKRLGRAAGLRNLLVHDYARIDLEALTRVLQNDLKDLHDFSHRISEKLIGIR